MHISTAWVDENQAAPVPVAVYVGVAIMWVLPDRELEEALND